MKLWTVTVYDETGSVVDYASFDTKAEASIYGRCAIAGCYNLNFSVKCIEV